MCVMQVTNVLLFCIHAVFTNIVKAGIAQIKIDTSTSTVYCNLLSSYTETMDAVCSITYGYSPGNCDMYTDTSITTTGRPGTNLTIGLSQNVNSGAEFCYIISLKYGVTTVKVVGSFTPGKTSNKTFPYIILLISM